MRAELRSSSLDLLLGARGERQLEALVAEHAGDREADPRGAAGDECAAHHATIKDSPPVARIRRRKTFLSPVTAAPWPPLPLSGGIAFGS